MTNNTALDLITYFLLLEERHPNEIVICPLCNKQITRDDFGNMHNRNTAQVTPCGAIEFTAHAFGPYNAEVQRLADTPCNNVMIHERCLDEAIDAGASDNELEKKYIEYLSTLYDKDLVKEVNEFLAKLKDAAKLGFADQIRLYEDQYRDKVLELIQELENSKTPYPMIGSFQRMVEG